MKRSYFALPYTVWMVILIFAPMLLIVYYALTDGDGGNVVFSLANMAEAFDPLFTGVLLRSVWLAFIATAICLLLGYPVAYMLARSRSKNVTSLLVLFILPMWMNFLLRTYAWLVLLDNNGLLNSLFALLGLPKTQMLYTQNAVVLGMVYNFLPFMVLPIHSVLVKIDKYQIEAAEDLGANSITVFRKVIFPQSIPGVITGITMVFVPAITTFAISRLLGGSQFMLFGDLIENQFIFVQNWHFGSALSLIMLALVLLSLAITNKFDKAEDAGGRLW